MHRDTFAKLALVTFGLILVSFVVMGFSRIVLPYRTARLLAAPTMSLAAVGVVVLFVQSVLAVSGLRPLEE
ncbi:hypothetical protein [Halorarius litoreus]|uniref:hypothetical protein n=1 Tax=Halorarius litoreus TaxID=2962676 RepID=UPI0020CC6DAC|nr:hypothetical protein [Halorarius litoreus]